MNIHANVRGTSSSIPSKSYSYRSVVSFEDTNLMGNVYFTRHLAWQGRCREMFLKDHVADILDQLSGNLRIVTLKVGCEYFEELRAFDDIEIRMTLSYMRQHRIGLAFDYFVRRNGIETLAAQGFQEIGCMTLTSGRLEPTKVPSALAAALSAYS